MTDNFKSKTASVDSQKQRFTSKHRAFLKERSMVHLNPKLLFTQEKNYHATSWCFTEGVAKHKYRKKSIFSKEQVIDLFKENANKNSASNSKKIMKTNSAYSQMLRESKKISKFYGNLSKKYLQKIFNKSDNRYAMRSNAKTGENFFSILESRLDVILYRSGFFESIASAKQMILIGAIQVNNKKVISPSYLATPGDVIFVIGKKKSKSCDYRNASPKVVQPEVVANTFGEGEAKQSTEPRVVDLNRDRNTTKVKENQIKFQHQFKFTKEKASLHCKGLSLLFQIIAKGYQNNIMSRALVFATTLVSCTTFGNGLAKPQFHGGVPHRVARLPSTRATTVARSQFEMSNEGVQSFSCDYHRAEPVLCFASPKVLQSTKPVRREQLDTSVQANESSSDKNKGFVLCFASPSPKVLATTSGGTTFVAHPEMAPCDGSRTRSDGSSAEGKSTQALRQSHENKALFLFINTLQNLIATQFSNSGLHSAYNDKLQRRHTNLFNRVVLLNENLVNYNYKVSLETFLNRNCLKQFAYQHQINSLNYKEKANLNNSKTKISLLWKNLFLYWFFFSYLLYLKKQHFVLQNKKSQSKKQFKNKNLKLFIKSHDSRKTKVLHLETSYKSLSIIFLFAPQRINFPFFVNLSLIYK